LATAAATVFRNGVLVVEIQRGGGSPGRGLNGDSIDGSPQAVSPADASLAGGSTSGPLDGLETYPTNGNGLGACPTDGVEATAYPEVSLLRTGDPPRSLLQADPFWTKLQSLRQSYGLILLDLPPVGESEGACALAGMLDGILLVIEAERTPARVVRQVKEHLDNGGARLLGVILNRARQHLPPWFDRHLP